MGWDSSASGKYDDYEDKDKCIQELEQQLEDARKEIYSLDKQVVGREAMIRVHEQEVERLKDKIAQQNTDFVIDGGEIERLRSALVKYGRHEEGCGIIGDGYAGQSIQHTDVCTCGLEQALKGNPEIDEPNGLEEG
jgi:hypothetical protein